LLLGVYFFKQGGSIGQEKKQRHRKRILNKANSAMIEKYSFGKIVVNGVTYTNDIKIIQGRVVPDWWRKKGHSVGIEDVQDILESKTSVLVIGKVSLANIPS
jgi:hypothetical protein